MAELELKEKQASVRKDFEPIEMSDGTQVTFHKEVSNEKRYIYAEAKKGENEVGRVSWSDASQRFIITVNKTGDLGDSVAQEIAETLFQGVFKMLNE